MVLIMAQLRSRGLGAGSIELLFIRQVLFIGFVRGVESIEVLFIGFMRQVLFIGFVRDQESFQVRSPSKCPSIDQPIEVLFRGFARGDGLLTEESMARSAIAASATHVVIEVVSSC